MPDVASICFEMLRGWTRTSLLNEWMEEKGVVVISISISIRRTRRTDAAGETETPNLSESESTISSIY
jgi:hypothetical protein